MQPEGGGPPAGIDRNDVAAVLGGCLRACMRGKERVEALAFAAEGAGRIGIADFGEAGAGSAGLAKAADPNARPGEDRLREWQAENERKERAAAAAAARGETLRDPNEIDIGQLGSDDEAVDNPLAHGDDAGAMQDVYDEADLYDDLLEHIEPLELPLVPPLPYDDQEEIPAPKEWDGVVTSTMYKLLALELLMWSMPDEWWHDELDDNNTVAAETDLTLHRDNADEGADDGGGKQLSLQPADDVDEETGVRLFTAAVSLQPRSPPSLPPSPPLLATSAAAAGLCLPSALAACVGPLTLLWLWLTTVLLRGACTGTCARDRGAPV